MRKLGIAALVLALLVVVTGVSVAVAASLAPGTDARAGANLVDARTALATRTPFMRRTPVATPSTLSANQAWLGITLADVNAQMAQRLGLSEAKGVVITAVTPGGPAAAAGVNVGDLVDKVNGVAVATAQDVVTEVRKGKPGDTITLSITRAGKSQDIKVTAGQAPTVPAGQTPLPQRTMPGGRMGGMTPVTGTPVTAQPAGTPSVQGGTPASGSQNLPQPTNTTVVTQTTRTPSVTGGTPARASATVAPASPTSTAPRSSPTVAKTVLPSPTVTSGGTQQRSVSGGLFEDMAPELRSLLTITGDDPFSRHLGATVTIKDKDGKPVTVYMIPGTVKTASASGLTITPNNPDAKSGPFTIDDTTTILAGVVKGNNGVLKVGDPVAVIVVGSSTHAAVIVRMSVLSGLSQLSMLGSSGMMSLGGASSGLQLPSDFFQNPQEYLGSLGGMFMGLTPQTPAPLATPTK